MVCKRFLLVSAAVLCAAILPAQERLAASSKEITFSVTPLSDESSAVSGSSAGAENDGKKHYLTAFTGAYVACGTIFLWNKYLIGAGWTIVTWDYASHFYEHRQSWDKDWYWPHFVLHPYQGSLSYLAGRNANLNRIESFALSVMTDFTWEYFCETNSPSKNDLVYSSVGAFPVGEMLYRLSLEADSISRLFGYALNPQRLWSEAWLKQKPQGSTGNIYELSLAFDMGTGYTRTSFGYDLGIQYECFPAVASPRLSIVYNDPYGHDSNSPYSQFNLDVAFAFGAGSGKAMNDLDEKLFHDVRIISDGMLFARAPESASGNTQTTVGLVFEYDFIWNNVMQLSSLAPGLAVKQRINFDKSDFEWQLHGAWIMLGTTEFDYLYRGINETPDSLFREYSYTTGAELVTRLKWKTQAGQALSFDIHGYAMYDFEDQRQSFADTGWELIGLLTAQYEFPLSRIVRVGAKDELYAKKTLFSKMEDVFLLSNSATAFVKFQLK